MPTLILWSWSLAALAFGALAAGQLRRAGEGLPRRAFVVALVASALWSLAMAGIDPRDPATRVGEAVRTLAWLGFMWAMTRRSGERPAAAVGAIYGVVALVVLASAGLALAQSLVSEPGATAAIMSGRLILRMMVAMTALVLTHHLHGAIAPPERGGLRLLVGALAAMWAIDLASYGVAWWIGGGTSGIAAARGTATAVLVPVLAVAAHRGGAWRLHVSRSVAVQSLSALALAGYVGVMLGVTSLIDMIGGPQARLWQTGFVIGASTVLLTLLSNPWLRAWCRVKLAKHLFRHRYDYRAEWVRFTDTLGQPGGQPGGEAAPLERRIVQAVADLTCSPAGVLLVPDGAGLGVGTGWNWTEARAGGEALARHLADTGRIIELDAVRAGPGGEAATVDARAVPEWMLAQEEAWAIVPLIHLGTLTGAILLARPPVDRALDWEDFDLLRICGRQVASYLAEARALGELAEARRFDEFNRRFAFIVHDIKNLVSQLSLVARNAERHAENPAFRADMVATLRDSADRMNALLARLSQHHGGRQELAPVDVLALAARVARERRAQHPVIVEGGAAWMLADAGRLEQLLAHLVQNAIEASPAGVPIVLAVSSADAHASIDVIDRGCGMAPGFLRDELFRPFHSSKPGGFGIGAFEARQLAEGMGGRIEVSSRVGEGTRFRVSLPVPAMLERAA